MKFSLTRNIKGTRIVIVLPWWRKKRKFRSDKGAERKRRPDPVPLSEGPQEA